MACFALDYHASFWRVVLTIIRDETHITNAGFYLFSSLASAWFPMFISAH